MEDSIRRGRVKEEMGSNASRNSLQTVTLLDAMKELRADAALGGARRDEEKAWAKERCYSHGDVFGQWDPRNQRPELWNLYNGRRSPGEHFRVIPLSNRTEVDIWRYIHLEEIPIPHFYFAHEREVIRRDGILLGRTDCIQILDEEEVLLLRVRFRTIGDATCTGAVESEATSVEEIIFTTAGRVDDGKGTLIGRFSATPRPSFRTRWTRSRGRAGSWGRRA